MLSLGALEYGVVGDGQVVLIPAFLHTLGFVDPRIC